MKKKRKLKWRLFKFSKDLYVAFVTVGFLCRYCNVVNQLAVFSQWISLHYFPFSLCFGGWGGRIGLTHSSLAEHKFYVVAW